MKGKFSYKEYISGVMSGEILTGKLVKLTVKRHLSDLTRQNAPDFPYYFDENEGERWINFAYLCRHWKGTKAGKPIELNPWQQFYFMMLFGWRSQRGGRRFRNSYLEIARKNGKALWVEEEIPTLSGWKRMGDIKEGDYVIGSDGKPYIVKYATDQWVSDSCYKVSFSDGSSLITDGDHLWGVETKYKAHGYKYRVCTTSEIRDTLIGDPDKNERNYRIKNSLPVEYNQQNLLIPPYVLGVWIGDGLSASGRVVCCDKDLEIIYRIRDEYKYPIGIQKESPGKTPIYRIGRKHKSANSKYISYNLHRELVMLGILNNKHIPEQYKTSSVSDRFELLKGLMDTDGYCSKAGQCQFTTIKERLAFDVHELLCSLGIKSTIKTKEAKINGRGCGIVYMVSFFATSDTPVFHLKRKQNRLKNSIKRSFNRQIVSVEKVENRPVRCISVDSPNHLYLAGRGYIPTHNTTMAAVIALGHKIIDKEAGAQVYFVATKEDQARIGFNDAKEIVSKSPGLNKLYKSYAKSVVGGDSVIKPLGSDSDTQDGFDPSVGIVDEYHAHQTSGMLNVLRTGMGMRRSPLISIITTAGFNRVYPCYSETRTACIKILNGVLKDERQFALIYTLDEEDDWSDRTKWVKSNPNICELEPDYLDIQYNLAVNEGGSMEVQFKTKNLNVWCDSERTWIPDETWMACAGDIDELEGKECYAALDLSSNKDITAFVLVFPGEKLQVLPFFFIPELSAKDRAKKDGVNYGSWINSGYIEQTEGNVTDYDYIRMRVGELAEIYQIKRIAYDRWNSSQLIINLTADGFDCSPFGQGFASMSGPTKELEKMVMGRQIVHDGNPVLRWMCSNISIATDPAGNVKINKQKAREKVDGMVALVMAIGNYMTAERTEEQTNEIWLI